MKVNPKPKIFVISGPGGAGKTTLLKHLLRKETAQQALIKAISVTTRKQRPKEKDGQDYFFIDQEEFGRLRQKNFFLESQKVLDDYYGTPRIFYRLAGAKNKNLILCIDVKGAMDLKKNFKDARIVTIFIAAPNQQELYQRMKKRKDSKSIMHKRVELAKEEAKFSQNYDYLIVNKKIEATLNRLEEIIFPRP